MYARTGTTSPIFISRDPKAEPRAVQPGQDYFFIKIHAAQAAFRGSVWDRAKGLVVTSQINLNHRNLGNQSLRAIQHTYEVRRNIAQPLGLNLNLTHLLPAVMPSISIGLDFILDRENQLVKLSGLINNASFFSLLSLATGPAAVAKAVAGLADKVIQTFIPLNDQQAILSFKSDFNLATLDLKEGYYVIIGTRDDATPLPDPSQQIKVRNHDLFVGGMLADRWSYVILDVQCTPTRPREMNDGAPWDAKLREAEDAADVARQNLVATDDERKQIWARCLNLLQEAQTLLRADENFLRKDAVRIITAAVEHCRKLIDPNRPEHRGKKGVARAANIWMPERQNDLAALGLPSNMDVDAMLNEYAVQVFEAREALQAMGLT